MTSQSMSTWLNMNIKPDDIDCGLAADFDGSLSGLGVELGSSTYNMSEALLALPVFKQEHLDAGRFGGHGSQGVDFGNFLHQMIRHPQPLPRFSLNELGGFHGNVHQSAQYLSPRPPVPTSAAINIRTGGGQATRHQRQQVHEDEENARHSREQDSPGSNDASGFSVDVLRGALLSTPDINRCRYVLHAATSPATKMNEETLTYLNQGQPYEIRLTKYGDGKEYSSLKSIIRVVFHDRRLQYAELEQLQQWRMGRPGERLLDIDVPLSTGVYDLILDSKKLNSIAFKWDPKKECNVFVKVHCISTEFTPKKHGGEKGVPFRVQVETYDVSHEDDQLIHCASCQVKVFKPKGADRKQKTDRDKMEKKSGGEKEKYQPSYEVTVLSEIPVTQAQGYLDQLELQERQQQPTDSKRWSTGGGGGSLPTTPEPVNERATPVSAGRVVSKHEQSFSRNSSVESFVEETLPLMRRPIRHSSGTNIKKKEEPETNEDECKNLSASATAAEVQTWLQANRFPNYMKVFQNFSGSDLLRLTRDDLIQICGLVDGIRLDNALQSKTVRPKLTIYVTQYDDQNTKKGSKQKLSQQQQQPTNPQQPPPKGGRHHSTGDLRESKTQQTYRDRGANGSDSCSGDSIFGIKISPTRTQGGGIINQMVSSKRQYRDSEELNEEEEVSSSKKQRTRILRMSQAGVYHALYFDELSERSLIQKISDLFSIFPEQIIEAFVVGPSGISVIITDDVVQNLTDQSRYHLEVEQDEDNTSKYRLLMKPQTSPVQWCTL